MVKNNEDCDGYYFVRYQELLDKKKLDKIEATWEDLMNLPMPPNLCYIIFNEKATIHYTGKLQKSTVVPKICLFTKKKLF